MDFLWNRFIYFHFWRRFATLRNLPSLPARKSILWPTTSSSYLQDKWGRYRCGATSNRVQRVSSRCVWCNIFDRGQLISPLYFVFLGNAVTETSGVELNLSITVYETQTISLVWKLPSCTDSLSCHYRNNFLQCNQWYVILNNPAIGNTRKTKTFTFHKNRIIFVKFFCNLWSFGCSKCINKKKRLQYYKLFQKKANLIKILKWYNTWYLF